MSSAFTDPRALVTSAYADPANLTARTAIYAYQRPRLDLVQEVVRRVGDVDGPILDVGCGPGRFAKALRDAAPWRAVVACDLSAGMATVAGPPAAVGTAAALPFGDRVFNGSLALHVLYHLDSPDVALAELARVTAGTVLISTNAVGHRREMHDVHAAAARDVGLTSVDSASLASRFNLDEAETAARRHFRSVERTDLTGTATIPNRRRSSPSSRRPPRGTATRQRTGRCWAAWPYGSTRSSRGTGRSNSVPLWASWRAGSGHES
jgi:SAM-dependent methyltransferase